MRLFSYLIILSSIVFLSFDRQQHPIHKEWQLLAERITYFNLDGSPYDQAKDRLDSVKNVTVQFLPDGSFKSREGNGSYTVSKDSVHLSLNGKKVSYKYELDNSKLIMETHFTENSHKIRSRLYME